MKVFVLLALLFVSSFAALTNQQYQNAFIEFMHKYSKSYAHDEFQARFVTFKKNLDFINNLNAQNRGFKVAMNKFGDLSNQEFVALYTGLRIPANYTKLLPLLVEMLLFLILLTGVLKGLLLKLKIKDNVVLAGLSLLLDLLKVAISSELIN